VVVIADPRDLAERLANLRPGGRLIVGVSELRGVLAELPALAVMWGGRAAVAEGMEPVVVVGLSEGLIEVQSFER
jgi:hypothetical protein